MRGLWKYDLMMIAAVGAIALGEHVLPAPAAEEEVVAEAGAGPELSPRRPRVDQVELMRRECREKYDRELVAWRQDGETEGGLPVWRYACINAWLRPEQILGL